MKNSTFNLPELKCFEQIVKSTNFAQKDFTTLYQLFEAFLKKSPPEEIPELRQYIHQLLGEKNLNQSLQGFAYRKPHGYAGDFEIIDKMYREETHNDPEIKIWDEYYHSNAAAAAVRNRKAYFKTLLKSLSPKKSTILNLASGPCRDLFEHFQENETAEGLKVDCVDMDENAIQFAKNLNNKYLCNLNFINKNVLSLNQKRNMT